MGLDSTSEQARRAGLLLTPGSSAVLHTDGLEVEVVIRSVTYTPHGVRARGDGYAPVLLAFPPGLPPVCGGGWQPSFRSLLFR